MWAAGLVGSSIGMIPGAGYNPRLVCWGSNPAKLLGAQSAHQGRWVSHTVFFSMLPGWNWKRGWFNLPEKDLQDEGMITVAPIVWCDFEGPEPRMKWEKHLLKSGTFSMFCMDVSDVRMRVWHTCPAFHAVARPAHRQCCAVSHRLRGHKKQLGYGMEMPTLNWWPSRSTCKHMFNIRLVCRFSKNAWNKLVDLSKNTVDFRDPNLEAQVCKFIKYLGEW